MAEEIIRYGAGGVPYKGSQVTTQAPEPYVEHTHDDGTTHSHVGGDVDHTHEEAPAVSVTVTEKETPGDIPTGKKGSKTI